MRVSFSTGTFYHRRLHYSLALAHELGYDGVELVLGPGYLLRGIEPALRALRQVDVPILSVHPPFFRLPGWPRAFDEAIPRLASATRAVDAELCVVHTPFLSGESSPRAERYSHGLQLGLAAGNGVRIALENNQYNKRANRYYLDDLDHLTHFALNRGCGVTFDTCHAGANGEDLLACYEIVRPALRNVHLSDVIWREGNPHTHRLPGSGSLPLAAFLARLAEDGYDGLITLELHPTEVSFISHARTADRLRQALAFVRTAIASPAPHTSPAD